jgi:hypothetical protein
LDSGEFKKKYLSGFSSHPEAQQSMRKKMVLMGLGVFAVIILWAIFAILDDPASIFSTSTLSFAEFVIVPAVFFVISFLLSFSLSTRFGEVKSTAGRDSEKFFEKGLAFIVLAFLVGVGLPILVARMPGIPESVRFVSRLTSVLPLLLIMIALAGHTNPSKDKVEKYRGGALLLFIAIGYFFINSLSHSIFDSLANSQLGQATASGLPWLASGAGKLSAVLALTPILIISLAVYKLWPAAMDLEVAKKREGKLQSKSFLNNKFVRWILKMLGWLPKEDVEAEKAVVEEVDEDGNPVVPSWIGELFDEVLPQEGLEVVTIDSLAEVGGVELTASTELDFYFPGMDKPSRDQEDAFNKYVNTFTEGLEKLDDNAEFPGADLILQGAEGAGKTTVLIACAIKAFFSRGQKVLVLAADDLHRGYLHKRLLSAIKEIQFENYCTCVELTDRAQALAWFSESAPLADIIVTTLSDYEQSIWGASAPSANDIKRLRNFILKYEVVLVDDLLGFSDEERAHLPFTLAKIRAILSSGNRPGQMVLTAPELESATLPALAGRVLGARNFSLQKNSFVLRRRKCVDGWHVKLKLSDESQSSSSAVLNEKLHKIVQLLIENGKETVLIVRGIDKHEQLRQQKMICADTNSDLVHVVSSLDQLAAESEISPDTAVYLGGSDLEEYVAVNLGLAGENRVIFSVERGGVGTSLTPASKVPVFSGLNASLLSVSHMQSLAKIVPKGYPIDLVDWAQAGMPKPEDIERLRISQAPSWSWEIDRSLTNKDIKPLSFIMNNVPESAPIRADSMPSSGSIIAAETGAEDEEYFLLPALHPPSESTRLAQWQDPERIPLDNFVDLAHAHEIKLNRGGQILAPNACEVVEGKLNIISDHYHGNDFDSTIPVFNLKWAIPSIDDDGETLKVIRMRGSIEAEYILGELDVPGANEELQINGELVGLANGIGEMSPQEEFAFDFEAWPTIMFLKPMAYKGKSPESHFAAPIAGEWSNQSKVFNPTLTAALNNVLSDRMPGFRFYCRLLAFDLPGSDIAESVVFILEPSTSGRTVSAVLGRLLKENDLREKLFADIESVRKEITSSDKDLQDEYIRSVSQPIILSFMEDVGEPPDAVFH